MGPSYGDHECNSLANAVKMSLPTWGGYENGKYSILDKRKTTATCFHSEPLQLNIIFHGFLLRKIFCHCPLLEGYLDLAIGYLSLGAEIETDLKGLILDDWNHKAEFLEAWADCINQGIVKDPWAWRSEVDWQRNK